MGKSAMGVIGLGVMGKSISTNIINKAFSLSVYNRSAKGEEHVVDDYLKKQPNKNIQGFTALGPFVESLEKPAKILLMVKAGAVVDSLIEQLQPLLDPGDIIIDGGNSHFDDTNRRTEVLEKVGIHFIGTGISGGEAGALNGPSIMPGGDKKAYEQIKQLLEAIAARDTNHQPCCSYIGPQGAGHFVKMIHNGIEYVEMQLLTEIYALLARSMTYNAIADILENWGFGEHSSYLLEITKQIFRKKEGETYLLDLILDQAGNKGTGSWSTKAAFDLGSVNTMMSSAIFARYISALKVKRVALSKLINRHNRTETPDLKALKNAYHFARLVNHQQGFEIMRQASQAYQWNLNLSEIARIWTNGCIIKSRLMESLTDHLKTDHDLLNIDGISDTLLKHEEDISQTLRFAITQRIALPAFSTAYQYWLGLTTAQSPANLLQAQRDFFGAHTYQRIDAPSDQFFHTNWLD